MCKNPMWRIPVKNFVLNYLFSENERSGYVNGAFIVPQTATTRYEGIFGRLSRSPQAYKYAQENVTVIGCGKCLECKLKTSKDWAQRSVAESLCHQDNWFITLTYDDEHLPPPILTFSRHSYEFGLWSPLLYEDFELFKKRLLEYMRYHYNFDGIRFFMCGEYGPKNGRPHFHVIFYNLSLPDIEKYSLQSLSGRSYLYMVSDIIDKCWGKGFTTIGEVNWDTSAYVGRYVIKKLNNFEEYEYQKLCFENFCEPLPPEMRQASRNPGLGRPFYEEHKHEIYANDRVILPNGKTPQPCSYFDRLYDLEQPEILEDLKKIRKYKAELASRAEQDRFKTTKQYLEYKEEKYNSLVRRVQKLKRPL